MGKQAQPIVRKRKKMQLSDGEDRKKRAEKKKSRLQRAIAFSTALRAQLENEKLKKLEEQTRLHEEVAAIARGWDNNNIMGISSDLIAASQAMSSLQISKNAEIDEIVFNKMFIG